METFGVKLVVQFRVRVLVVLVVVECLEGLSVLALDVVVDRYGKAGSQLSHNSIRQ